MSPRAKDGLSRALQLARSGCSDPEIAAVLSDETPLSYAEAEALLAEEELATQVHQQRLAGRAFFRDYVFRAATPETPTSASLSLATWLSRQNLGYATSGLSGEVGRAAEQIDSMTDDQLAEHLESQAAQLRSGSQVADA